MEANKLMPLGEGAYRLKQFIWNGIDFIKHEILCMRSKARGPQTIKLSDRFFICGDGHGEFRAKFEEFFPGRSDTIIEKANKICNHYFDILGNANILWGSDEVVNWHFNPLSKKTAPNVWWQRINLLNTSLFGDIKFIWELNRHQHFLCLALAYGLSDEIRYKDEFLRQIESWIDCNMPKRGVNWCSSLELAYRSIAWTWSLYMFHIDVTKRQYHSIVDLLILHGDHIHNNLSIYHSPNTHLTGEALALYYLGSCFPGLPTSSKWITTGKRILLQEVQKQVLSDGGYMERSLYYHKYTTEIYLHFLLLARINGDNLPDRIFSTIEKLGSFLMYSCLPDRTLPAIGDDDGGRLLPFCTDEPSDLKGLFSTLAVLFQRGDFKYLSEGYREETFILLGPGSKSIYDSIAPFAPLNTSKEFISSGYFFMRNNWSQNATYVSFDCGPHGWLNCGHAHADMLSFQVFSGSRPIIIDQGTYSYVGKYRDYFRGPEGHSIVKVDGCYPAVGKGPFHWAEIPQHEFIGWVSTNRYDYVSGMMSGEINWKHNRELFFVKPGIILVCDSITTVGKHQFEIRFPLYGSEWTIEDNRCQLNIQEYHCIIECVSNQTLIPELVDSWVSRCYGHKIPSQTLLFKGSFTDRCSLAFMVNLSDDTYHVERLTSMNNDYFTICSTSRCINLFPLNSSSTER
jgi:hypothetical protein